MSDRVRLDWRVPTAEWERFREWVESEFADVEGAVGREAEAAMRAYVDADDYDRVEELVDRLVQAAGRRPSKEKTPRPDADDSTRVCARVDEEVKHQFREVVREDYADYPGQVLARALREHREGGRADRLERKLERVVDDAEDLLGELDESDEEDAGLTAVERRTIAICDRLHKEQFTDADLVDTIADVAGDSQPTIEKYRERVVERLDVEPHPENPDLWMPSEQAEAYAPEGQPEECRWPVERLPREDRVRRIVLEVGRRAADRSNGTVRETCRAIRREVLDSDVSLSTTHDYLEAAAREFAGVRIDPQGERARLKVNLGDLANADPDLFERIIAYRDGGADGMIGEPAETTLTDAANAAAAAATDGGEPGGGPR